MTASPTTCGRSGRRVLRGAEATQAGEALLGVVFVVDLELPVIRFVGTHTCSRCGRRCRKARPRVLVVATPLIRVKAKDLEAAGVERVPACGRGYSRGSPQEGGVA